MKLKSLLNENNRIFRNDSTSKWSIVDTEVSRKLNRDGLKQIGIGLLKAFEKKGQDSEYTFVELYKNEKTKEQEVSLKPGERLVRYMSRTTLVSDQVIICVLNADKGYMKYMKNIDDDPDMEDAKWGAQQKFAYLRVNY